MLTEPWLKLMLDFVPNHMAPDHPWIDEHPDYFVHGSEIDLAHSPRNYCRVKTKAGPLLLAYGGADRRVPLYHGEKFYKAVKQTNPDVEWIVYPDEGHGWALPKNQIDFWSQVERFLDKHIGQH